MHETTAQPRPLRKPRGGFKVLILMIVRWLPTSRGMFSQLTTQGAYKYYVIDLGGGGERVTKNNTGLQGGREGRVSWR